MTAILGSVRGGGVTSAATSRCIAVAAASAAACTSFSLDAANTEHSVNGGESPGK